MKSSTVLYLTTCGAVPDDAPSETPGRPYNSGDLKDDKTYRIVHVVEKPREQLPIPERPIESICCARCAQLWFCGAIGPELRNCLGMRKRSDSGARTQIVSAGQGSPPKMVRTRSLAV